MKNGLYSHLYLHLKNAFTWKKSSQIANLLLKKPGNWFTIAKILEKNLKKKDILRKVPASLLKVSLWDGF